MTEKGFDAPCIRCGQSKSVALYLSDLESVACTGCNEDFMISDVRKLVASWAEVLKWIDVAKGVK